MEGKVFSLIQTDTHEQHRARQQGPTRDAPSQPGLHGRVVKLHIHGLAGSHSHIITAFMFLPLKQLSYFQYSLQKGNFLSGCFLGRREGQFQRSCLLKLNRSSSRQQTHSQFGPGQWRMRNSQYPPCRYIAGNPQGSVTTFFSCCLLSHYNEHQC